MTAGPILWQDPPPVRKPDRGKIIAEVRSRLLEVVQRPGRWALVYTYTDPGACRQHAWRLRNGILFPGAWGAASRGCDLYVIYHGRSWDDPSPIPHPGGPHG
jgi:hypothetical protein